MTMGSWSAGTGTMIGVCAAGFLACKMISFFTVKLEETFDVCMVRNDKRFIVINIISCASFVQRVISGFFFNSISTSHAMLYHMYWRSLISKTLIIWRR